MRLYWLLLGCFFGLSLLAQDADPVFRTEARSAFIWGRDAPAGAVSSEVQDPLSGQKIRKLTYNGIELGSRVGYEAQWVQVSKKLSTAYTVFVSATTVVNNTNQPLTIKFGGAFYDGAALPFLRESRGPELPHFEKPFTQFDCFRKGRFKEGLFVTSADESFVLQPGTSIDFTALTARLWSEFIFSKREFRYFVKVDNKDFVFSWARPLYDYDLCGVEFLVR